MLLLQKWAGAAATGVRHANNEGWFDGILEFLSEPWLWVVVLGVIVVALFVKNEKENNK